MNNMLFEFPFIAEVWGTVSDWVMIFVTAITAYLLWNTLQEQKEFTKIELERFSREKPPTFTSGKSIGNSPQQPMFPMGFHVRVTNNRLKNLVIFGELPERFKLLPS